MTETSSIYNTYPLTHQPPVAAPTASASPLPNGAAYADTALPDEEEYTIKCICVFADDDGNTVYCEQCDTWQHILCYYLDRKKVPEIHFCVDCQARDLDARKATERQRRAREQLEGGDRRVKKPSSKTTKKKQKDVVSHEPLNGWTNHERHDSITNGRDHPPPAKKPKTSHRTSGSVVSLNGDGRKRAHSNVQSYPSPSKSPQDIYRFPLIPQYTTEFLDLYERDCGNTNAEGNEHTISALNHLSRWKTDRGLVVMGNDQQPNIRSPFVYLQNGLHHTSLPQVTLDTHKRTDLEIDGKHPIWQFLRLQEPVKKDTIVGEIRGEVGMLEEYCRQQSSPNRWTELEHPDPFVFFHPHMHIYIDSRRKGTQFRYLRRSCQPNVTLRTLVADEGETKHCFVATKDISAGSELTAAWYLNPAMFDLNPDREDSEQVVSQRCDWISRVLANFGDCACGDHSQCPWARLDRRTPLKASDAPIKSTAGRKRKAKLRQAISPLSTGQATNSRAGSEAVKGAEDDDQDDRRSTSDSTRSGPRSRDLTPVNGPLLDADPVLGVTLTSREMRKIQAAEKAFEKEKMKATDEKKKKKRTSGGSTLNTPNPSTAKNFGQFPLPEMKQSSSSPPPRRAKDGTERASSSSRVIRPARPVYVSIGVQTDPEPCDLAMPPLKRVRYITPTQRLLKHIKANRERFAQKPAPVATASRGNVSSLSTQDVEMKDVGSGISPTSVTSHQSQSPELSPSASRVGSAAGLSTFPLPSQAAHTQTHFKAPPPKLHLSTLPPVPAFPNVPSVTPGSSVGTPSLTTPVVTSPQAVGAVSAFANLSSSIVAPSPVKKKMSLGDYMSRKNMVSTPSSERPPSLVSGDSTKSDSDGGSSAPQNDGQSDLAPQKPSATNGEGPVAKNEVDETPIKDESEAEYSPPGASPPQPDGVGASTSTEASIGDSSKNVADVLARLSQYRPPSEHARSQTAASATTS